MAYENLRTVRNYAKMVDKTTVYIYQLIKDGKVKSAEIDGVKFVKIK